MGDTPLQPGAPAEFLGQDGPPRTLSVSSSSLGPGHIAEHLSVYPSTRPQQQPDAGPQHAFATQLEMTHQQRPGGFDMSSMASALPQQAYRSTPYGQSPQRYNAPGISSPGTASQIPVSQYGAPNAMGPAAAPTPQYYLPQPHMAAQYYPTPLSPQPPVGANMPPRGDVNYYGGHVMVNQQHHPGAHYYYPPATHFPGQSPHVAAQLMLGQYAQSNLHQLDASAQHPHLNNHSIPSPAHHGTPSAEGHQNNVVRGPPRKPRQSGHAIWIGNLPPQTELMSLVHHVCKEADGLESLFLISKSNCAFANFKDEQACIAAQRKLHDSKFMTVRLVSRLRKSTVEGPAGITAPTGPAISSTPTITTAQDQGVVGEVESSETSVPASSTPATVAEASLTSPKAESGSSQKDRFFVLKSLTVEDLELSVRKNIWATQSHNEETLNNAFNNSDNVYLVFSANKSGEYFGYARMTSPINDDPAAAIEFAPKAQSSTDVDLPKAIATEATEFAPKGRIIDDSARGTIFWEADRGDQTPDGGQDEESGGSVGGDGGSVHDGGAGAETKAWGKPFRLEWLSIARLPFYKTRGLRNPWNSNREVKIARDGTELEPSVGRRLIGLFNRTQSPAMPMIPGMGPVPLHVPVSATDLSIAGSGYPMAPNVLMR
ncbi:YT521-B-like domain-containing protein [Triangularia verruculosa]|uniref:YT521-B-like domain-containing protein n=1 Tax=Triangularia verruculosa TaxID=2587418 RepID=A0AAN7AU13_9PEZI|nr:YT521-B-like domain-containing protein [Triangularia verruculosa]